MADREARRKRFLELLAQVPDVEPEPYDQLPEKVARALDRLADAGGIEEVFPDGGLARTPRTIAPGSSPQDRV